MYEEQTVNNRSNNQSISSREQRLIELVEMQWLNSYELSSEALKQTLLTLPNKYKTMAIRVMAEQFVNVMKLHLLHIAATFYQQSENEGITSEERNETLQDVEADVVHMMELGHQLTVATLGDLFKLGKITASAQALSKSNNAEEAQRWLYNLPTIYQGRLEREHLTNKGFVTVVKLSPRHQEIQVKFVVSRVGTSSTKDKEQQGTSLPEKQIDESRQWGRILSPRA